MESNLIGVRKMKIKLSEPGAEANYPFEYRIGDAVRVGGGAVGTIVEGHCNDNAGRYQIVYDVRMENGAVFPEYENKLQKVRP